jgi:hypothetical protein
MGAPPRVRAALAGDPRPGTVGIEIVPDALLRGAAWPMETLGPFTAPGLADAARELLEAERRSSGGLADHRAAFDAQYADSMGAHLRCLRSVAATAKFRRALVVASPDLASRWEAALAAPPGHAEPSRRARSRTRRMEVSLFRYLVRAATRPCPHGLWAWVAPVRLGEHGEAPAACVVSPNPARYAVTVDLRPFTALLDGAADDSWTVLRTVGARLAPEMRPRWTADLRELRRRCDALATELDALDPGALAERLRAIEAGARALAGHAGSASPGHRLVRVDMLRRARVVGRPRASVRTVVGETLAFLGTHGGAEAVRRHTMGALLGAAAESGLLHRPVPDLLPAAAVLGRLLSTGARDAPEASRLLATLRLGEVTRAVLWRYRVDRAARARLPYRLGRGCMAPDPLAGPGGVVVLTPLVTGRLRVEWGLPRPLAAAGRFGALLSRGGTEAGLFRAVRDWYGSWARHGIEAREVVGRDVTNPSAALCPLVTSRRLDTAGTTAWRTDAVVVTDAVALRPWLTHPSWDRDVVPVCDTAATMGAEDPLSFLLYRLALAHGWEFTARRVLPGPVAAGYAPRIELPSGDVLSPARWWLGRSDVAELVRLDGGDQYLAWRGHVERLGLPAAVWVVTASRGEATPQYLLTTSPLAVSALFARLPAVELEFFEVHGDPTDQLVVDEAGRRYASELAVLWRDDTYWPRVRTP